MQLQFLGAADAVTGSRHLVTLGDQRILLDCGLFQGFKVLRERNWAPLGLPPHTIDAVVLSHAHLDHSGWLPGLVKAG
ncbi:MAG TPA: MBL fold metallo-hydrolase, partial [Aquabacterium sp.]|nr:MBL fold metallo-hydrolase [Aquabacterium sp.]